MNRTGLTIALAIAVAVGVMFAVCAATRRRSLAALFYDPDRTIHHRRQLFGRPHMRASRAAIVMLVVAPAFLAVDRQDDLAAPAAC